MQSQIGHLQIENGLERQKSPKQSIWTEYIVPFHKSTVEILRSPFSLSKHILLILNH